jgi:hypothetical protein
MITLKLVVCGNSSILQYATSVSLFFNPLDEYDNLGSRLKSNAISRLWYCK